MSMRSYEMGLIEELRQITGRKKLRLKDLREWGTTKRIPREGEEMHYLPKNRVWAVIWGPNHKDPALVASSV